MTSRLQLLLATCLGLAAVALYWPTLDHGFVYDDLWNIQQNEAHRLERLDVDSLAIAGRGAPGMSSRPVSNLSFALSYYISRPEPAPRAYRWTNLLIHAGNAALVFGIFLLTLSIGVGRRSSIVGAGPSLFGSVPAPIAWSFLAALLWLAHPIQTQAVTYLHQRMTSLASLFFLGCLFAYILGRRAASQWSRRWAFLVAAVCAALALGSKELAAALPAFLVLYEWTFFQRLRSSWLRERRIYLAISLLVIAGVALLYLSEAWGWLQWMYAQVPYSPAQRLLTQSRVVVFGLSLLLLPDPLRLNVDHDLALSTSLLEPPTTLLALGLLAVLVGLAVFCARRGLRFAFFGVLWLLGTQLIESSVIPVEMVAEHRLYLPSVGLFFVLLELGVPHRRRASKWLWIGGACVALLFCGWTLERNRVWRDGVTLWADAAAKSPRKVRPLNNLGLTWAQRGEMERGMAQFQRALRLQPTHPETNFNLGRALLDEGHTEAAVRHLQVATRGKERLFGAHYALGQAFLRTGRHDAAAARLALALSLRPGSPDAHYEMGNVLRLQGKAEAVEGHYLFALARSPDHVRRHYELADYLFERGDAAQAMSLCETILRVQPDNAIVHARLALALARLGRLETARQHCEHALELNPELESARLLLEALVN